MTVHVSWFNDEQDIVHYRFEKDWDWNTLYPAFEKALEMEYSVSHRVDVIIELPAVLRAPPSVITNIVSIARRQPPNLHKTIFVSQNAVARSFVSLANNLSSTIARHYSFEPTIERALAAIEADRQQATNNDEP